MNHHVKLCGTVAYRKVFRKSLIFNPTQTAAAESVFTALFVKVSHSHSL